MVVFDFVCSLFKGFVVGNLVLAVLIYLEIWWKRQEHRKMLDSKRVILDRMQVDTMVKLKEERKSSKAAAAVTGG